MCIKDLESPLEVSQTDSANFKRAVQSTFIKLYEVESKYSSHEVGMENLKVVRVKLAQVKITLYKEVRYF